METTSISIARRFCGPAQSGNGGYVCGQIAKHLEGTATVRLFVPPPLEITLQIEHADTTVKLLNGTELIGQGERAELELEPPVIPSLADAEAAAKSYSGFAYHRFPRCFVCGPHRKAGDGLRIFTGFLAEQSVVAAPWRPDDSLLEGDQIATEFIWAALDCPGAFAVWPNEPGKIIVLGQLTVRIDAAVTPGEEFIVIGWPIQIDGRKRYAGSALFSTTGALIAIGRATWIEVPESAFPAETFSADPEKKS